MSEERFTDKIEATDVPKMPQEYPDLLVRVLTIQADCEIGGPHLYVREWLLTAPTSDDQWMLAKVAGEEIDHFRKMNRLLNELGHDVSPVRHQDFLALFDEKRVFAQAILQLADSNCLHPTNVATRGYICQGQARSRRISRAAFMPGPPVTPPPGCVPALQRYRPRTGVR